MENENGVIVFMKDDVKKRVDEVIENIRQGNLRGSKTRWRGIIGDIESAFGWHYPEKGQPKTDRSVTDLDRAEFLDRVIDEFDREKLDMNNPVYKNDPESTPREMRKWMVYKRDELRGEMSQEQIDEIEAIKRDTYKMLRQKRRR